MGVQDSSTEGKWTIGDQDADCRLDAFLRARLPFLSRRELDSALREKCFSVNGHPARKGVWLARGDRVEFIGPAARLSAYPPPNPSLAVPVIYETADFLALNKPAGMDCHGFSGRDDATLANFLLALWPELSGIGASRWEPGLVHRLDRETSGLVMVAKTQAAFDELRRQFRNRTVKKRYLALVWGSAAQRGSIRFPIAHDSKDKRKMRAILSPGAQPAKKKIWRAVTDYRKIGERQGLSLLELEMETGVTHQLRVHLAAVDHPVVGDILYGSNRPMTFGLGRHFLHASALQFLHPRSKKLLMLEAPLPAELAALLARIHLNFQS